MPAFETIWLFDKGFSEYFQQRGISIPVETWVAFPSSSPLEVSTAGRVERNVRGQADLTPVRSTTIRVRWQDNIQFDLASFHDPEGRFWLVDRFLTVGRRQYVDMEITSYEQTFERLADDPGVLIPSPPAPVPTGEYPTPLGYGLTLNGEPVQALRVVKRDLATPGWPYLYLGTADDDGRRPFIEVDVSNMSWKRCAPAAVCAG